jgi:hypothetical protein
MEIHWFLPVGQEEIMCNYIFPAPESKRWRALRMEVTNTDDRGTENSIFYYLKNKKLKETEI